MRIIMMKKKQNATGLAFALAVAILLPLGASAQGLFQLGVTEENYNDFGSTKKATGLFDYRGVQTTGVIDNQTFGQEVPMGSGIVVLLTASMGYAALKRKEEKQ